MYEMIDYLLTKKLKKGFEIDFINDMSNKPTFSPKQEALIVKIAARYGYFEWWKSEFDKQEYVPCASDCTCVMCRSCSPSQPQIKIFLHENPDAKSFICELYKEGMIDGLRNITAIS